MLEHEKRRRLRLLSINLAVILSSTTVMALSLAAPRGWSPEHGPQDAVDGMAGVADREASL